MFDLAIVAAVLAAQGIFRAKGLRRTVLLGELGLDGRVRPVRGILPATLAAQQAGFRRVIVPVRQAGEAGLVEGIEVFGIASITQLVAFLQGASMPDVEPIEVIGERAGKHANRRLDLADVVGQPAAVINPVLCSRPPPRAQPQPRLRARRGSVAEIPSAGRGAIGQNGHRRIESHRKAHRAPGLSAWGMLCTARHPYEDSPNGRFP